MEIGKTDTRRSFIVFGLLLGFFIFFRIAEAETEIIRDFSATITIREDGSVFVSENIIYDFGPNQKHGIFRDIPLTATAGPRLDIEVLVVSDEEGQPYPYTTAVANDVLRIKIGDPNIFISGVKTYNISYLVHGAIRTFSDHDELYWNVTGNQWPVPIQGASAMVTLPADFAVMDIKMDCFTGPQGSTQKDCVFDRRGTSVSYSTNQPLKPNEGLTFVLGMPPGYITKNAKNYVSPRPAYSTTLLSLLPLLLSIIVFVGVIILRSRSETIKPQPVIPEELVQQPVAVEYNPPPDLSPIEIGTLLDRRVDITDISSVIVDLATRGYIKIRHAVQEIKFWPDRKDFEFVKLKEGTDLIHPADKIIFGFLFNRRDRVRLNDLKERKMALRSVVKKVQLETERRLREEGYFDRPPRDRLKKLKTYLSAAAVILYLVLFFALKFSSRKRGIGYIILFIVLFIVAKITLVETSARQPPKLTSLGISTLRKILGFKDFLQLTEKDKLQLLNAPELRPEMFEKFLPYAMVLGVENEWAKKFEGIYNTAPSWYEDHTAPSFSGYVLVRDLELFNQSFNQVFNIASSRTGSGFGGGGSSGGGSGGGGGGGW